MGRKIRLSIALPVVQVLITATLTLWANSVDWMYFGETNRVPGRFLHLNLFIIYVRLFWRGINAPAFPFSLVSIYPSASLGDVFYLTAVGMLWNRVGRFVDRRRGLIAMHEPSRRAKFTGMMIVVWGFLLLGVFVLSLYSSLHIFPDATKLSNFLFVLRNRPWVVPTDVLFLLWSLILIVIPGRTLLGRRTLAPQNH